MNSDLVLILDAGELLFSFLLESFDKYHVCFHACEENIDDWQGAE